MATKTKTKSKARRATGKGGRKAAGPAKPKGKPKAKRAAPARRASAGSAPAAPPPVWVWHELVTRDVDRAKAFYAGLFGWAAQDVTMPSGPYTLLKRDGTDVGGLMRIPVEGGKEVCAPHWCTYVAVDDVDASARRAQELGGTCVAGPMDVAGVGRFAVLVDPGGATISVFKGA